MQSKSAQIRTIRAIRVAIIRATRVAIALALGLFSACQSNAPEQPTLPDEKIARIMADFSIADAATTGLTGYAKDSLMQVYFKQVFEMHGLTLEAYEKDLRILAQDLPRMERVVEQAEELLTERSGDGKPGIIEN
ncbi:MAG: DUF4296 domain-containing protein [Saprospiraceae bacterium]